MTEQYRVSARWIALFIVWIASGFTVRAQSPVRVSVTDRVTQAPVEGALVRLEWNGRATDSSYTDAFGQAVLDLAATDVADEIIPGTPFQVGPAYPNPGDARTRFDVLLAPTGGALDVDVYNMLGQRVAAGRASIAAVVADVELALDGLAAGMYVARFRYGAYSQARPFIVRGGSGGSPGVQIRPGALHGPLPASARMAKSAAVAAEAYTIVVRKDGYVEQRVTRDDPALASLAVTVDPALEQVIQTVTTDGATLTLGDGTALVVPAGGVAGTAVVEFSSLAAPAAFDTDFQQAVHVTTAQGVLGEAYLVMSVPDAEVGARTGAVFLADEDSLRVVYLNAVYDAGTNTVSVPLVAPVAGKGAAGGDVLKGVYIIEKGLSISLARTSRTLEIPYYEQDGGNCWAAAWLAQVKAYQPSYAADRIYETLHQMSIGKDDGFHWTKMDELDAPTAAVTGHTVTRLQWTNFNNWVAYLLLQLDRGRPVMTNLLTHQILFVGYEITDPGGPGQAITLIGHDPANWLHQIPYMRQPASYYRTEYFDKDVWFRFKNQFVTLVVDAEPASPPLLTIHLPDRPLAVGSLNSFQKGMAFAEEKGNILASVAWDHTKPYGLTLERATGDLATIALRSVPVWNMSRSGSADAKITTRIFRTNNGVPVQPPLFEKTDDITVPAGTRHAYALDVLAADFKDGLTAEDTTYALHTLLETTSGERLGSFAVDFLYIPLGITALLPDSGYVDAVIDVQGFGFGWTRGDSRVLFNGVPAAGYHTWNDTNIRAVVPAGASTGDVVVQVMGKKSNGKKFKALQYVPPALGPHRYELRIFYSFLNPNDDHIRFTDTFLDIDGAGSVSVTHVSTGVELGQGTVEPNPSYTGGPSGPLDEKYNWDVTFVHEYLLDPLVPPYRNTVHVNGEKISGEVTGGDLTEAIHYTTVAVMFLATALPR